MQMYCYLVSCLVTSKHGTQKIETFTIYRPKPISIKKDLEDEEKTLKSGLDVKQVDILSFSQLKGEI